MADVPTIGPEPRHFGNEPGRQPLTAAGWGIWRQRPYGDQLHAEAREVNAMHYLRPTAVARLRAATRRALGR